MFRTMTRRTFPAALGRTPLAHVRRRWLIAGVAAAIVAAGVAVFAATSQSSESKSSFSNMIASDATLVTNEFAHWNPDLKGIHVSSRWQMDSGSLFAVGPYNWTGFPDDRNPDINSKDGTNSAVFRLVTNTNDYDNVTVTLRLLMMGLITTPSTPSADWDGVHIFLRYQDERSLYYATVNRRDNQVVVKKKVPGGTENGGTYYELGAAPYQVEYGDWQDISVNIHTLADGAVQISTTIGGKLLLTVTDHGENGPPILAPGRVGIRGDNANFLFADFAAHRD